MMPTTEHESALRDVISPGYTALCLAVPPAVIEAVATRAGPGGLVIACGIAPVPVPAQVAFLRCSPQALPILSHSIDGAVTDAAVAEDDAALSELRRVLAPGRALALLLAPADSAPASDLRALLATLGFVIADAGAANAIVATVPPWMGTTRRQRA